ncbi:MAG: hypothetical protein JSR82_13625 [Verrucomicrobia bacterium]|nr:hypothetical protein [Verrucomicrobiota bacterium]
MKKFPSFLAVILAASLGPDLGAQEAKKAAASGTPVETEIQSEGEATFDAEAHTASFTGGVTVTDTRFKMKSEKLTVFLTKPAKDAPKSETKPEGLGGGVERAVAEGGVTIEQAPKPGQPDGQQVTGRAAKAVFEPKTGQVTLSGSPVVRRGVNEHIGTSPNTVMIIGRDGSLRTSGPSRTMLRDTGKSGDLTAPAKKP